MKPLTLFLILLLVITGGSVSTLMGEDKWGTTDFRDEESLRKQVEQWAITRDIKLLVAATIIDPANKKGCALTLSDYQMLCELPAMPKSKVKTEELNRFDREKYAKTKVIAASADGKKRMEFLHAPMKNISIQLFKESDKDDDQWNSSLPIVQVDGRWFISGRIIIEP